MKYKRVTVIIVFTVILVSLIIINLNRILEITVAGSFNGEYYNGLPVYYISGFYENLGEPESAIGATDYTFIAKINAVKRTEYDKERIPFTIYNVAVIENIKGELIKTRDIEIRQMGGINKYHKSYTFLNVTRELLNTSEYYILLVRVSNEKGTLTLNPINTIIPLGQIENEETINAIGTIISCNSEQEVEEAKKGILKSNNINMQVIEKVIEYKKASYNQIIQSEQDDSKKTILYDIEYNK